MKLPHQEDLTPPSQAHLKGLGKIAAGMAYEINNPLTVIAGKTSRMERTLKDLDPFSLSEDISGLKQELEKIDISVARISRIVQELISYVQGQGEHRIDSFSLDDMVCRLKEIIPATVATCPWELDFPEEESLRNHKIQGHLHLIEQVVVGMVENSVRPSPHKKGRGSASPSKRRQKIKPLLFKLP